MSRHVSVPATIEDEAGEEIDVDVICHVTRGTPARGPTYDCAGEPAEPGEVEVLSIVGEGGASLSHLIDTLTARERDRIEDAAVQSMADAEDAAAEDAYEARREAQGEWR